jgi:GR25 family glycosyltransferase involved in LPS biosynthesis
MDFKNYFDRVVVINLKRRPDRLARFRSALLDCRWPFMQPVVFEAIDGTLVPSPDGWQSGGGAWGCMRSHQRIFEQAIMDGVENLLILEDDACFVADFAQRIEEFLLTIPNDWDQLMLGGEHVNTNGIPVLKKPGVYRCTDCERTHCYAIRREFLKKLYRRWARGGEFNGEVHCDWIMGRDPEMQYKHNVYAPEHFLVGQERGKSDVNGAMEPRKFWNPPDQNLPVISLRVPQPVAEGLRQYGIHTGRNRDTATDIDNKLKKLFAETQKDPNARVNRLTKWIIDIQWEVASDPYLICAVWHPEATPQIVKMASPGPVYEVSGPTVESALQELPKELRRPYRPLLALAYVIHLQAPQRVMEGLRERGWHNGFCCEESTLVDKGLMKICGDFPDGVQRIEALRSVIKILQNEAEGIYQGVAVIWHPEIDVEMTQAATSARVIGIAAMTIRDAIEQWEDFKAASARKGGS